MRTKQLIGRIVVAAALGSAIALMAAPTAALASEPHEAKVEVSVHPKVAAPGETVTVTAKCESDSDTATLDASSLGLSEFIEMTRSEEKGCHFSAKLKLPHRIKPGAYHLFVECGTGKDVSTGETKLIVSPKGAAHTGGGWVPDDSSGTLLIAGVGMLGAAAVGGLGLLWRRRTDASVA